MAIHPLIHIGYHKTATTLFQDRLFIDHSLGFRLPSLDRLGIQATFVTPIGLSEMPDRNVQALKRDVEIASASGHTLVVSHERLSGYPASGGYDQGIIAERLYSVFPEGKVLILIREQRSVIYSMYLQSISDGSTLSLYRFLNRAEPGLARRPAFTLEYYEYDRLIDKYSSLFGSDNVKVVAFENFKQNPQKVFGDILRFTSSNSGDIEIPPEILKGKLNVARPLAYQWLRRQANRLVRNQLNEQGIFEVSNSKIEYAFEFALPLFSPLRKLDRFFRPRLEREIDHMCAGHFRASNSRTARITGLNLAELGYDV